MKNIYLFSGIVFILCSSFCCLLLVAHLSYSPISVSKKTIKNLQCFLPQGWAFFTRNPKEQVLNIYQINKKSIQKINYKSADLKFFFGANKSSRLQMYEVGAIIKQIPDSLWIKSRGNFINVKILDTIIPLKIINKSILQSIGGKIIIEKIEPIPWAWNDSKNSIKMPSEFTYLNVSK